MMPPEWDFGDDDAKRRAFIGWVWTELDRLHALLTPEPPTDVPSDWMDIARAHASRRRPAHREASPDEWKSWSGMNVMVREYALVRWIFERHWPRRTRRIADPAHAAHIAISRCREGLPLHKRAEPWAAAYEVNGATLARKLRREWARGADTPGRRTAATDRDRLDNLSDNPTPD